MTPILCKHIYIHLVENNNLRVGSELDNLTQQHRTPRAALIETNHVE